jgi:hypothetical protein
MVVHIVPAHTKKAGEWGRLSGFAIPRLLEAIRK